MTDSRLRRALPTVAVLVVVVVAFVLIALAHWRKGAATLAGATALAGVLRAVLPEPSLGPLAVRTRTFDLGFYGLLTVALLLLSVGFNWL
jgi:hypothetical protein